MDLTGDLGCGRVSHERPPECLVQGSSTSHDQATEVSFAIPLSYSPLQIKDVPFSPDPSSVLTPDQCPVRLNSVPVTV
jgi:hypothetical protein